MAAAGHREGPECPWVLRCVQPALQGVCVYPQSLGMNFVFLGGEGGKEKVSFHCFVSMLI